MHPINSRNFGNEAGKIAVKIGTDDAAKDGFIVRQIGTARFVVSDGVDESVAVLSDVAAEGTITIALTTEAEPAFVAKIESATVYDFDGVRYSWNLSNDTPSEGVAVVATLAAPVDAG